MYARRIQITNYGPIEQLDIEFPFDDEGRPKPVVLVGQNGSGKSILVSHIVNGLIAAKDFAYGGSPELAEGQVYKIRSNQYIKSGSDYYFARFDFADSFFTAELRVVSPKADEGPAPAGIADTDAQPLWDEMESGKYDAYDSSFPRISPNDLRGQALAAPDIQATRSIVGRNCVLYFPPNRFDEPAWLNHHNLTGRAVLSEPAILFEGETAREAIASDPLRAIRDWLFDVIFDMGVFEVGVLIRDPNSDSGDRISTNPPAKLDYRGPATTIYQMALAIVRRIIGVENAGFDIGHRQSRLIILHAEGEQIAPNLFQLSSGEVSLLNLFLSILRDYDACGAPFSTTAEVRGIVVVDEIDLHLHVRHQHDVLPSLIAMFPNVQFVVTTHSPLFVLGMSSVFGDDGFDLRRLPDGEQIDPEEFSEFEDAYQSFTATRKYADETRAARELIDSATKPLVFVEGKSDIAYISRAASLLGRTDVLDGVRLEDGNGVGSLTNVWKHFGSSPLADAIPQKVVLLFDNDAGKGKGQRGKLFKRTIPQHSENPIEKGIENLFSKTTLAKAKRHNTAWINVAGERPVEVRGETRVEPEIWSVSDEEKMALCEWLCENGTAEDFEGFKDVLNILEAVLQSGHHDEGAPD